MNSCSCWDIHLLNTCPWIRNLIQLQLVFKVYKYNIEHIYYMSHLKSAFTCILENKYYKYNIEHTFLTFSWARAISELESINLVDCFNTLKGWSHVKNFIWFRLRACFKIIWDLSIPHLTISKVRTSIKRICGRVVSLNVL